MVVLVQFVLRLSFGLALAMAVTPPRLVSSGYYRVHMYVLLGLNVLAATVIWLFEGRFPLWPPITAAVLSYVGSIFWLYEKPRPGVVVLLLVAGITLYGARGSPLLPANVIAATGSAVQLLTWLDPVAGGLVLGVTMAAMLLGHWYLNAPGMKLAPLRRLVLLMGAALMLRAVVCAGGFVVLVLTDGMPGTGDLLFISLRWLAGLLGAAGMAWMTWLTLKIPNTQSATGVLYVAVILTFVGELTGQLLSASFGLPV